MVGAFVLAVMAVTTTAQAQTAADPGVLERDLDDLMAWLVGEFSNWRQVDQVEPDDGAPPWLEGRVTAVEVDGLEGRLRWLELASGSEPETVLQRRLFEFWIDVAADAIVMRTLVPAAGAAWPPAADDLEPVDGCDLVWRRVGPEFVGTSNPTTCRSVADDSGVPVERVMRLDRNRLEIVDRPIGDGTTMAEPPLVLYRARRYAGTLTVGGVSRALDLHDEGGRQTIDVGSATWRVELASRRLQSAAVERLELRVVRELDGGGQPVVVAAGPAEAERLDAAAAGMAVELVRDPTSDGVATLAEWLTGSFSSAVQAATDDEFFDIRLHMAPIWTGRDDGPWMYVEQAVASAEDRPYRQRVYRLREVEPGLFESAVYTLPDPDATIGAWEAPGRLDGLSPADLETRTGCSILMRRLGDAFVGSTLGALCPSELRGARYATSEVRVTRDRLVSWDRGFDAAGTQVWGARTGGYVFDRMTPDDATAGDAPGEDPPAGGGAP
jgi:hypothetical protein